VTLDVGYADIGSYAPSNYPGLIVLRLKHQDAQAISKVIWRLIGLLEEEELNMRLWNVDESRIRIRK